MLCNIVYFAFVGNDFTGVEQKIVAQFDALQALGVNIRLFMVSSTAPRETFAREIEKRPGISILLNSFVNINNLWYRRKEKFDLISMVLLQFNPDKTIIYFRYPVADILFLRFIKRNKAFRFVTEHQDIENTFGKGKFKGRILLNIFELLWGSPVRKLITGFVGVTEEITSFALAQVPNHNHYFETIGNGIDTTRYPLRIPKTDSKKNEIRILFIGAGFKTHGLDRLIKSIYWYYKNNNSEYEIYLKIAGDSNEMHINNDLVKKLKLTSRITIFGNLKNEKINELFNWAHIGVGSLGIHRKGLKFTSELKAREYCARGLPFFWSTFDNDFDQSFPYIFQVWEDDSQFDLNPVIKFALRVNSDMTHLQKMRQYAVENLDWSVKMGKLLAFFEKIERVIH